MKSQQHPLAVSEMSSIRSDWVGSVRRAELGSIDLDLPTTDSGVQTEVDEGRKHVVQVLTLLWVALLLVVLFGAVVAVAICERGGNKLGIEASAGAAKEVGPTKDDLVGEVMRRAARCEARLEGSEARANDCRLTLALAGERLDRCIRVVKERCGIL